MLSIRQLNDADFSVFHSLQLRALKDHPESFLLDYEEHKAHSQERIKQSFLNRTFIGAFDKDTLVGYAGLNRYQSVKLRHKASVGGVYVAPEMRGKGVAKQMLRAVIDTAKQQGIELLQISANNSHTATINLYTGLGFEPYGIEKHILKLSDGSYVDDMLMIKFLR